MAMQAQASKANWALILPSPKGATENRDKYAMPIEMLAMHAFNTALFQEFFERKNNLFVVSKTISSPLW